MKLLCALIVYVFLFCWVMLVPYSLFGFQVYRKNRVLPMLANVKHLELAFAADSDDSLLHLNSFIKASPHLHKLILHVSILIC